jgi:hypothetical protein
MLLCLSRSSLTYLELLIAHLVGVIILVHYLWLGNEIHLVLLVPIEVFKDVLALVVILYFLDVKILLSNLSIVQLNIIWLLLMLNRVQPNLIELVINDVEYFIAFLMGLLIDLVHILLIPVDITVCLFESLLLN